MSDAFIEAVLSREKQIEERSKRLAKVQLISGAEMMQKQFPEPRYLWKGILQDAGIAVMAASKASGKTLLLLQLADAIARGRDFLGVPTEAAKTLFLELELSERRTVQRLRTMGVVPNDNVTFAYRWPQGDEGLQTLRDAIEEQGFELVIVDVLQMLWPLGADYNSYQDSYNVLAPLRQMANDLGVMIILVTHRRKMETADFIDGVMGSVGITANADVVLMIQRNRGENEAVLLCEGNDIESRKIALRFSADPLGFSLSDALPDEIVQTPERREILDAIRELGGSAKPGQVAALIKKERSNVSHTLQKMAELGLVSVKEYGRYAIHTVHTIHSLGEANTRSVNTVNTVNSTLNGGKPVADWPASKRSPTGENEELDIF